ncbi:hypothetical protein PMAYCL1PPCAC_27594, partial [Pristionchus mayeri]
MGRVRSRHDRPSTVPLSTSHFSQIPPSPQSSVLVGMNPKRMDQPLEQCERLDFQSRISRDRSRLVQINLHISGTTEIYPHCLFQNASTLPRRTTTKIFLSVNPKMGCAKDVSRQSANFLTSRRIGSSRPTGINSLTSRGCVLQATCAAHGNVAILRPSKNSESKPALKS